MTLAEAIEVVEDHLAFRERVFTIGARNQEVIDGLRTVLEAVWNDQIPPTRAVTSSDERFHKDTGCYCEPLPVPE